MIDICLARIDDRLIHGQIVIKWWNHLRCDEILIVDDEVSRDPFLREVFTLAGPSGVQVRVLAVAEAVPLLIEQGDTTSNVLLLMKSPETALRLVAENVPLPQVNVGSLAAGEGTRRVFKNVSLSLTQAAALEELSRRGVEIRFQLIPGDARADWASIRQRMRYTPASAL